MTHEPTAAEEAQPIELRAPEGARSMEILWSDGRTSFHRHDLLRGYCPCAHCQGHQGPIRWVPETDGLEDSALALDRIEEVGSYAVQLAWGDGHSTGIYSFRYLRELAGLHELGPEEARQLEFGR